MLSNLFVFCGGFFICYVKKSNLLAHLMTRVMSSIQGCQATNGESRKSLLISRALQMLVGGFHDQSRRAGVFSVFSNLIAEVR